MMQVICFYWEGDRWTPTEGNSKLYGNLIDRVGTCDTKLASQYVNNLFRGVTNFADREFEFTCFTNEPLEVDAGVIIKPFPMVSTMGVLPRMYMFSEASGLFGKQVLCIDIDVIVCGALKSLMDYKGRFCARSKFKSGKEYKLDGDVMSFQAGPENEEVFWKPFLDDKEMVEKISNGRERYWVRHVANAWADRWDIIAPGAVLSYKWHINHGRIKRMTNASLVSCHGHPRPHQLPEGKMKELWNGE